MAWTDERVELLKKLWTEGLSASQIAGRLGGVTRNAVIGKVHRLGLMFGTRGNVALKPTYEEELELSPAPLKELVIPLNERASILTLKESMCRWPIGDPGEPEFHFCGRKSCASLPYCEHHARMAYQPAQMRRREKRFASG